MSGFCGSCGAPRVEGARFCMSCGASLASSPEPCPTCGQMWTPPPGSTARAAGSAVAQPSSQPVMPLNTVPPLVPPVAPPFVPPLTGGAAPSGLPRGPLPGEDYRAGQDCGNCGTPLTNPAGPCQLCGTANVGPDFRPGMLNS